MSFNIGDRLNLKPRKEWHPILTTSGNDYWERLYEATDNNTIDLIVVRSGYNNEYFFVKRADDKKFVWGEFLETMLQFHSDHFIFAVDSVQKEMLREIL